MKPLFTFILALAILCCSAQDPTKTFTFKQIGWTVKLPPGFVELSAAEDAAKNKRGQEMMEEVTDTKMNLSETKTLFAATKNTHNYINSTLTPFDSKTDGSWEKTAQYAKDLLYITFKEKMPDALLDSASSSMVIDGLRFDKFRVSVTIDEKQLFRMFMLVRFYKGYSFGITYLCLDDETLREVETVLTNSKFSK